uniref:Complex 1 LYR protein domain-containing protein n=1 Tax=Oryza rufipogon TaxID=4529 RepID=A0A0E0NIY8_ORYRU
MEQMETEPPKSPNLVIGLLPPCVATQPPVPWSPLLQHPFRLLRPPPTPSRRSPSPRVAAPASCCFRLPPHILASDSLRASQSPRHISLDSRLLASSSAACVDLLYIARAAVPSPCCFRLRSRSLDELRQTVRAEIEKNRRCDDKQKIKFLISEGLQRLKGLDEMLDMTGNS